jgi:probable HAF family extracellular repeat protein
MGAEAFASAVAGTVALMATTSSTFGACPPYVVRDLGTIVGGDIRIEPGSGAWAISPGGTIVGLSITTGDERNIHGFRIVGGGTDGIDLGVIGTDHHSIALAVNAGGDAVGVSYSLGELAPHAALWPAGGGSTNLGDFTARDINSLGTVVGEKPVAGKPGVSHAVRAQGGATLDLGTLGGGHSSAMAINDAGWIVGESLLTDGKTIRAFVWKPSAMSALPTLGGTRSHGIDINNSDVVVGIADTASAQPHAVRWTLDGNGVVTETLDLGVFPGGLNSAAYAIDDVGDIVGTSDDRAVAWFGGGAVTDLNSQIDPGSGWLLRKATGINAAGQIVGFGKHLGRGRAFLLTPRAPADLNADGKVDGGDLGIMLAAFGGSDVCADLDHNGTVDGADLGLLLGAWTS